MSRLLKGVEWLYANDWWDGPISGVCEYEGKRYYAKYVSENRNRVRRYKLLDMPEAEWVSEDARHTLFVACVGDHFCMSGNDRGSEIKPQSMWKNFYDVYPADSRDETDYESMPVVGWFLSE